MTKLKTLVNEMYEKYSNELADFQKVHDAYMRDRKNHQDEFNEKGKEIMKIMRFYETQLCGKQERSGMGVYSSKLAEKFWVEIKKKLPFIDFVGVKFN